MEHLQAGGLTEVGSIGVNVQWEVGVGRVFLGKVGRKVPEAACSKIRSANFFLDSRGYLP